MPELDLGHCVYKAFKFCKKVGHQDYPMFLEAIKAEELCLKKFVKRHQMTNLGRCLLEWFEENFKKNWDATLRRLVMLLTTIKLMLKRILWEANGLWKCNFNYLCNFSCFYSWICLMSLWFYSLSLWFQLLANFKYLCVQYDCSYFYIFWDCIDLVV